MNHFRPNLTGSTARKLPEPHGLNGAAPSYGVCPNLTGSMKQTPSVTGNCLPAGRLASGRTSREDPTFRRTSRRRRGWNEPHGLNEPLPHRATRAQWCGNCPNHTGSMTQSSNLLNQSYRVCPNLTGSMKQTLSVNVSPGRSSSFGPDLSRGPHLPQNEPPETRVERTTRAQ